MIQFFNLKNTNNLYLHIYEPMFNEDIVEDVEESQELYVYRELSRPVNGRSSFISCDMTMPIWCLRFL